MVDRYCERLAPPGLAGVVGCLWRSETIMGREQRVLPDGCMDLIWMDGAVHVAGPDSRAFLTVQPPGQAVTGLRFRPGAAPGVFGLPACVLRDQRVRLEDLWPGTTVTQQVAEAPDPAIALIAAVAPRAIEPDRALRGAGPAADWVQRGGDGRCAGLDPTHAAPAVPGRIRLRPVGATPHPPIPGRAAAGGAGAPFATTATRAGYADQAHLAREVRALAGASLSQLIRAQLPSGANRSTPRPSGSCSTA